MIEYASDLAVSVLADQITLHYVNKEADKRKKKAKEKSLVVQGSGTT